jgi:DNA polymerase-3 subunit epsilon
MSDLRELVLDTETTGLEPGDHRIVEIGALELINHIPTGRTYHQYINPRRPMPAEAEAIHGISEEFLRDKPVFESVAQAFVDFIGDGTLVIHNAKFDVKFLNFELGRVDKPAIRMDRVVDTLEMARNRFPGAQNSLDGLCRRFRIDSAKRVKHGALLDSELLADVYVELIGGRQGGFSLDVGAKGSAGGSGDVSNEPARQRGKPRPTLLTEAETAAHSAFIDTLGDAPKWRALGDENLG